MPPRRFAFVLEQTLGHSAHALNIERALQIEPDVDATIIKLNSYAMRGFDNWPGLRTWSFKASWAARRALLNRIRSGPLDAVFIHTQVASLLAVDLMRTVPTMVSLDATPLNFDALGEAYGHRRQGRLRETVKYRVNRSAFGGASALVTWCRWAAESLEHDYAVPAAKVRIVHPGVDLERFIPSLKAEVTPLKVLFVGGNLRRKGGYDLIEAMRAFDPAEVELDMVTGELVDSDLPPSCRIHYGLQPQSDELVQLYRNADLFALPSRGDCFPQVIAEAMACGLPVIASDVGGIPEMVRHGTNGWLVSPGNLRELAQAIQSMFDPGVRQRFGRASLAIARAEHDSLHNNRVLFDAMTELMATRRSQVA